MTDTMQVEALEPIKSGGYVLESADRLTVPADLARHWIRQGWAKDPAEAIPTGERRVVRATVTPHGAHHHHSAEEVPHG